MAIERLTIANYDNLENKPIAAKNLATETVEDGYYLNKAAEKLVYTENPTNPDGSTIDKIYYNMNMSVDNVGQSLINMPWDDAVVQDMDGIAVRFLQLIGADTFENTGKGVYAIKLTFADSDLRGDMFYISAGYPNFDEEPYHFFMYSADFDATNVDIPQWGWIDFTNELLNPPSPISIPDSFTFSYMANKECWDTWFSTSNEFASSFDFEANTLYKRVGKAYKKIDGNVLEPVDKLPQPAEALKGRVVYNKKDNQIYECKEITGGTTETPISYESLLPLRSEWDSCGASGVGTFFINTDLDSDTVKAIFVGDDSGTLITAQDGCYTASRYVSYQHSGDVLQIIDNTDTCSPRTIFDSSLGGWQESSTAGWMPAEDGKYDYPRYTLNSGTYCDDMSLNSRRSPMGCLFSTSDGGFAGYKIVDGVYFNVHEKFDGSKMFANSSYPVLYSAIADITKQSAYSMMFVNSAVMGEGYEQAGWMILVGNDENYYPIYAENAFDWSGNSDGPQIVVATAGWQSEYVDLTTGKLKLPANGSISDVGRSMIIITEDAEVTEDLLGNYIGGTPFTKVEGIYKWSNLATSGEETLKLSGNDYKIIQHTSNESLELTNSNSAENVIIVGTIDGTLKIDEGCLETLTYIGYCNHLEVDLSDWINSTNYPKITLIGDGTATIRGNRMAVKTMGGLNVYEISTDNSYPAFFCDIIAGEDVKYSMVSDNSRTVSSQLSQSDNNVQIMRFDCRKLTLDPNDGSSSIYALNRFIDATCERFYIEKGAGFLRNEYNKVTTTDGGCKLLLHMPSYERALVDGCYATNYAGPGSVLGDKYLFVEPDTCNSSVYNRSWRTIQGYVDEKTSSGGSGASNPIKRSQFYASSWETSGNGYRCTLGTIDEDPAMVFVTPASNQASSLGVYGAAISEKTISVVSDAEQVLYGTSLLFNVYIIPCPEASYSQAYYIDNNIDLNSHVSYETAYNVAEANRVVCTGGMTEFWDTSSSWNAVYFNKYFPYTFNYDSALSGLELLYIGNSGTQLRLDYNPVDPSAFSLYVYSASASTKTSVYYENGKWLINPDVALYRTYQIPYSMSATAQKAAGQLLSWTGWTYTKKDPKTLINQIESNTSRITTLEESAGSASSGPNPTILAKSNSPVDAYDTCSTYGAMYLNKYFADNFDSSTTVSGLTLLYGDASPLYLYMNYTAHDPSSLYLYTYDGSNGADMSGDISQEIYKDGAWVIDPTTYKLEAAGSSQYWQVPNNVSANTAQIIKQLFSTTTKNGNSTGVTSAANAWTYTPLADVPECVIPPNIRTDAFMNEYIEYNNQHDTGADGLTSGRLLQCVWVGKLSWNGSEHDVRVAFRPIWTAGARDAAGDVGPTVFTSEGIGGNTLTLISTANAASYYPQLNVLLNDGTTTPSGTLYFKRIN